jgi:hypothetical protein
MLILIFENGGNNSAGKLDKKVPSNTSNLQDYIFESLEYFGLPNNPAANLILFGGNSNFYALIPP